MQVTVVVENFCTNRLLRAEWGYSLYLESDKTRLLLDTGSEGHAFTHNLKALQINPKTIEHIVFSHAHFDHTGGLVDAVLLAPPLPGAGERVPCPFNVGPMLIRNVTAVAGRFLVQF